MRNLQIFCAFILLGWIVSGGIPEYAKSLMMLRDEWREPLMSAWENGLMIAMLVIPIACVAVLIVTLIVTG
jgi:hypothetical protein